MDRDGFVALGAQDLTPLDALPGYGFDDDDETDAVTVQMRDPFAMTPPGVERLEGPPEMVAQEAGTLQGPAPDVRRSPPAWSWMVGAAVVLGVLVGGWSLL